MHSFESLKSTLQTHFNHADFRPSQAPLVTLIGEGRNVLGIMPTGEGKSACFQVPALLNEGVTVVITPLLSLMEDQVRGLKDNGIAADCINSNTEFNERDAIFERMRQKRCKLLYVSPELFARSEFVGRFGRQAPISAVVFDEAHCLSQWGDDFRPDYVRAAQMAIHLSTRYEEHGIPPIQRIALTATATPEIQNQLTSILRIEQSDVYKTNLARPNLRIKVAPAGNATQRMERLIRMAKHYFSANQSVIIYTNTRASVDEVTQTLRMVGVEARGFHAGMTYQEKKHIQDGFLKGNIKVVVATIAFGMGIDKPDIRAVIHIRAPRSIEDYYQQIGRAGRDGLPANCHLLFEYDSEYARSLDLMTGTTPTSEQLRSGYEFLYSLYASNNGHSVRVFDHVLAGAIRVGRSKAATILEQLTKFRVLKKVGANDYMVRQLENYNVLDAVDKLNEARLEKMKRMMNFGIADECKQNYILRYFGQHPEHACGQCSHCLSSKDPEDDSNSADPVRNPAFRAALVQLRTEIAKGMRLPPFSVMSDKCINNIIEHEPLTAEELHTVAGMNSLHATMHLNKIRAIISQYSTQLPALIEDVSLTQSDSQEDTDTLERPGKSDQTRAF